MTLKETKQKIEELRKGCGKEISISNYELVVNGKEIWDCLCGDKIGEQIYYCKECEERQETLSTFIQTKLEDDIKVRDEIEVKLTKLKEGCSEDIGGIVCGESIGTGEYDEDGNEYYTSRYYCIKCSAKIETLIKLKASLELNEEIKCLEEQK